MSVKVLVVDDEPLTREAYGSVIRKWRQDVTIREARNAPEMLQTAREWDPDVILLDIRIPGGDGLTAMKTLRDEGFMNEAVVTTAFDMFSYAKFAMDVRASSFLVKPIRPNLLIEALEKAMKTLIARRGKDERLLNAHQFLRANRGPIAMNILTNLIRQPGHEEEVAALCGEIGFPPARPCHFFGIIALPGDEKEAYWEHLLLIDVIQDILGEDVTVFPWKNHSVLLFVPTDGVTVSPEDLSLRILEAISRNSLQGNVVYGGCVSDLQTLPDAVSDVEGRLDESLLAGTGRALWEKVPEEKEETTETDLAVFALKKARSLILDAVRNNQPYYLSRGLEVIAENTDKVLSRDLEIAKLGYLSIFGCVSEILLEHNCDFSEIRSWGRRNTLEIFSCANPTKLATVVESAFQEALQIRGSALQSHSSVVHNAMNYIQQNYDDLSLETTADHVHVTPEHLSRLFQKVLKKRFVDVVREILIERAKALLLEGMSVRDVAISVGYGNISYFSTLFKQETGLSPSAFREQQGQT